VIAPYFCDHRITDIDQGGLELVIEGAQSSNRDHVDLSTAAARFPKGRFQRIPGAGHLIPREKSRQILGIISDFIKGLA
jgi:hypothetical protein